MRCDAWVRLPETKGGPVIVSSLSDSAGMSQREMDGRVMESMTAAMALRELRWPPKERA